MYIQRFVVCGGGAKFTVYIMNADLPRSERRHLPTSRKATNHRIEPSYYRRVKRHLWACANTSPRPHGRTCTRTSQGRHLQEERWEYWGWLFEKQRTFGAWLVTEEVVDDSKPQSTPRVLRRSDND